MRRRTRDIQGVLSSGTDVGGIPGIHMPNKGEQPREATKTLHVSTLEVKGVNPTGGNGTDT